MYDHWWSGWPGAYCLKCGAEDMLELAVAHGVYDVFTGRWLNEDAKQQYSQGPCPESDASYKTRMDLASLSDEIE